MIIALLISGILAVTILTLVIASSMQDVAQDY